MPLEKVYKKTSEDTMIRPVRLFIATLTVFLLFGCQQIKTEVDLETNKELVLRYHQEAWSQGNLDVLEEILSPDFVCHFIGGLEWKGIEGAREAISNHKKSFPDWSEEVVDIIAEGDKVVTRFRNNGTHEGEFAGIAPTGREVEIFEAAIYRIENGKIAEQWGFPDELSLRNQISTPQE
jgi:predicted ester cyclase